MGKITYDRRKAQGLCVKCGGKPAEGRVLCQQCLDKAKTYRQEVRKMCKKYSICPRCGKNKLFGDEKTCPECLAKAMEINRKWKSNNDWYRKDIKRLKEQGLCRSCRKRRVEAGKTYCSACLAKRRERYRQKYIPSIERSLRHEYGLCYRCGKPLDREGKLCSSCKATSVNNLRKAKKSTANHIWRKDNNVAFIKH